MSKQEDKQGIKPAQVLAAALAAATAAVLGSTLGVAGTVLGAAVASIISTVGGAVYLKSLERTREGVRTVTARVTGRGSVITVSTPPEQDPAETPDEVQATGDEVDHTEEVVVETRPPATPRPWRKPLVLVAGGLLVFAMGMAVVTGLEWVRGEPLSGGGSTTVGSLVSGKTGSTDKTTTTTVVITTPPAATTEPTNTGTDEPTTTTGTTSGSETPTTQESTPEQTTTTTTTRSVPTTTTTQAPSATPTP
ncbi:hypothetical protein UO65_4105 [Actinokineospora spheciospongiae]|uniref:Uncharacterized protein n=1 Tax=Actinokineospora spheciospongiae TaxID=909613 RepID=W7IW01_9PSEU|nr:hypothetical protein [Actinokineospora spheciospongiae]EWC60606.1 hypothetical protein UO65_4105 [Actinokineospora spheciospongiae]PWW65795.1 hypothetical protein DFQ13_102551 [Actinokineospora spheciospongiae]